MNTPAFARLAAVAVAMTGVLISGGIVPSAASTTGGPVWHSGRSIDSYPLVGVSCASASFCVATDYGDDAVGYVIVFNGKSWSHPIELPSSWSADSISCVPDGSTKAYCLAISNGDNGGGPWAQIFDGTAAQAAKAKNWGYGNDTVPGVSYAGDGTCIAPHSCLVIGDDTSLLWLHNGNWSSSTIKSSIATLNATGPLACGSPTSCWVAASSNDLTYTDTECSDNGGKWACGPSVDDNLTSISCALRTPFCAEVDSDGLASTTTGASWAQLTDLTGGHSLYSVSCPAIGFCVAVGGRPKSGTAIGYYAGVWSSPSKVANGPLVAVSCVSSSFCMAIGGSTDQKAFEYSPSTPS